MQDIHSNSFSIFFSVIDIKATKTVISLLACQNTCWYSGLFACRYSTQYGSNF